MNGNNRDLPRVDGDGGLAVDLAAAVDELAERTHRVLVGIDGPDAAGKTTLADRVAARLATPAVRASVDRFHNPPDVRYRRGALSPYGYFADSFDYDALVERCLRPFRDGAAHIWLARGDVAGDSAPTADRVPVPARAVLVVDGVFLLRPELRDLWTLAVYLRVSPAESLRRALGRDSSLFGSRDEVIRRYRGRYLPGQTLYREAARPESTADIVVDNEQPNAPRIIRPSGRRTVG